MELLFLGTSAGVPTRTRNMTSIILNLQQPTRAEMWLFDCGEGTQHQFLHTPYHPGKLNKIFITHLHGDHLFGPGRGHRFKRARAFGVFAEIEAQILQGHALCPVSQKVPGYAPPSASTFWPVR